MAISMAASSFLLPARSFAGYKDDIGYTRLATNLSGALPKGSNVTVSHIEAFVSSNYMPNTANDEFAGKTFDNVSNLTNGISSHSTEVGQYFYGTNTSIAPAIGIIDNYEADDWMLGGFLNSGTLNYPAIETNSVQNHSWIASGSAETDVVRRLDYAIDRDGFVAAVGLNNGAATTIPAILAHSYNAICVGLSSGDHSRGQTTFDGIGRLKPDIVAPLSLTSDSTPVIGAAAAFLIDEAKILGFSNGTKPQCIKSIIMAGASRDKFSSWSRTPSQPLDQVYGAGELNIFNSYYLLKAGEQESSSNSTVPSTGWDYNSIAANSNRLYFFDVPQSNVVTRLSVVLTWHRRVYDGPDPGFNPETECGNLELHLYEASGYATGNILDSSTSTVDNVEMIYVHNLREGRYALKVSSDTATNYAIAWQSRLALIPECRVITLTNNGVVLSSTVTADMPYGIQASTNLMDKTNWVYIATNTSATNIMTYIDSAATNIPVRFYRFIPDP